MKIFDHIIVGASQAGLTAARTLRENRPQASILVINGEDRQPYKRTHLTKKLASGFAKGELTLFPDSWYKELNIERIDSPALRLHPEERIIELASGESVQGNKLLLATGALPLVPDIPGKEEILHLRSAHETEGIREKLLRAESVLIIGQGVEGVEMAEQCRLMGRHVTSTSTSDRLMSRWLDEELSRRLDLLLASQGIHIRYGEEPLSLCKQEQTFRLTLSKGETREEIEAQLILASTGITGDVSLISSHRQKGLPKGLLGKRGIVTDEYMQTLYPGIYAAGDVVQVPPGWASGLWHSAEKQGQTAALNMAGIITPRENTPIRLKCEVFGDFFFSMAFDRVQRELPGSLEELLYSENSWYLRIFFQDDKALGGLMQGLKSKAKELAGLIQNGADKKAFENLIALS